ATEISPLSLHDALPIAELAERIADVAELLLGVVQRFTRALAQFRAVVAGRFLLVPGCRQQADANRHHVGTDTGRQRGTVILAFEFLDGLHVLPQEVAP